MKLKNFAVAAGSVALALGILSVISACRGSESDPVAEPTSSTVDRDLKAGPAPPVVLGTAEDNIFPTAWGPRGQTLIIDKAGAVPAPLGDTAYYNKGVHIVVLAVRDTVTGQSYRPAYLMRFDKIGALGEGASFSALNADAAELSPLGPVETEPAIIAYAERVNI